MKKLIAIAATSLLVLAGCATDFAEPNAPASSSTTAGDTTSSVSTTKSSTTTSSVPSETTAESVSEPVRASSTTSAGPTFVRCYLADGTALMSDGSHVYMDSCHESASHPNFDSDAARSWSECVVANGQDYCARQFAPTAAPAPDPLSDGFTRDPSGAIIRPPEVEAEKQAGHDWWGECIAVNTAEYCRANDPWQ